MDEGDPADATDRDASTASADAFAALGHEHRVAILRALLEAERDPDVSYPTSFSRLRELAGIERSSQFSYHLSELDGRFLARVDGGYRFLYAGWKVVRAIAAGTYDGSGGLEPTPVDGTCYACAREALTLEYVSDSLAIGCEACGQRLTGYPFPPGPVERRHPVELADALDTRVRADVRLASAGHCPECFGRTVATVDAAGQSGQFSRETGFSCTHCGNFIHPSPGLTLLEEPTVRQFCAERGVDVEATPFWELRWCVDDGRVTVFEEPPWRCRVRVEYAGDVLLVDLDDGLGVIDVRRG